MNFCYAKSKSFNFNSVVLVRSTTTLKQLIIQKKGKHIEKCSKFADQP